MSAATRARLAVLAGAVLFSTGGAAIKFCQMSAWQVASFRSGVAALVLFGLLPTGRRDLDRRGLAVGVAYASTMLLFVLGNKLTTAANTIFLQSTAPLYILLLAPRLLGERNRPRDLLVMAAVVVGLLLCFAGDQPAFASAPDPRRGNLLAAASGLTWAVTVMGLRWINRDPQRRAGGALVAGNLLTCLLVLPLALADGTGSARDWAVIVYLGVFQIAVAYVLVNAALRQLTALEGVLLLLLEPVLNPLWAWLVQGERPAAGALLGGAIVLGATLAKTVTDTRSAA